MATNRTIILKGDLRNRYEEAKAGAASIKPGMQIKLNSSGAAVVQSTAGAMDVTRVVIENAMNGKTVDDAYTNGEDGLQYYIPRPGDLLNLLLTGGENVAIGDAIIVNTTGKYIKTTGTPAKTVGVAEEALNLTSLGDKLLAVRII